MQFTMDRFAPKNFNFVLSFFFMIMNCDKLKKGGNLCMKNRYFQIEIWCRERPKLHNFAPNTLELLGALSGPQAPAVTTLA